jgi:type VI secretion system protein ImpG
VDARFLHYYNLELKHLREMGAEFASDFPKVAARLAMKGTEVDDPYVERLLEGVGFMAARVHLKLDAEFPRFTQTLLEIIYPHYLAPTPAMVVAQFQPEPKDPSLASGTRIIPRGTALHATTAPEQITACEFRTAQDVPLWPLQVEAASVFSFAPDLQLNTLPIARRIKGGLRIRLEVLGGLRFDQLDIDSLCLYLSGADDVANTLLELCLATGLGVLVKSVGATPDIRFLPPSTIRPIGFTDDQALLPVTVRSFRGYRLLQEYFSFPQRYRFIELTGLREAVKRIAGSELELVVLFGRGDVSLEGIVDRSNVQLFCTPAINLFEKRHLDRINITDSTHEFQVIPDRTRPLDFEVYHISEVTGHAAGDDGEQRFLPFYSASSAERDYAEAAYFTTRRVPRLVPEETKRRGSRSSYVGSEVFLSLVDSSQAPYAADLRQLSIKALCTNRDLVLLTNFGRADGDFTLSIAAPIAGVRVISGPSWPYPPLADDAIAWHAVSHLSLNYLSLVDSTGQEGAAALRDLLALYARRLAGDGRREPDPGITRQIEGIRSVGVERMVRRLPQRGPLAFGRGLEITVDVDETAFAGGSAFMLGAVLSQYFARYVSINSVTETVLRSQTRGEINRWTPSWGSRPTL